MQSLGCLTSLHLCTGNANNSNPKRVIHISGFSVTLHISIENLFVLVSEDQVIYDNFTLACFSVRYLKFP